MDLIMCISHWRVSVIIGKSGKGMVDGSWVELDDNTQISHSALLADSSTLN